MAVFFVFDTAMKIRTGKIPAALWELPCLRVVALHGNSFKGAKRRREFERTFSASAFQHVFVGGVFRCM